MAAKGTVAKENLITQMQNAFGDKFVGVYDKKVYIWSEENGEPVQICLSLTCPKNPVGQTELYTVGDRMEFEAPIGTPAQPQTEITEEETQNIANLMAKLGL